MSLKKRIPSGAPLRRSKRHMTTIDVDYEKAIVDEPLNLVDQKISETIIDDTIPEDDLQIIEEPSILEAKKSFSISLTIDELLSSSSSTSLNIITKKMEENESITEKLSIAKNANSYDKLFTSSFMNSLIIPTNIVNDLIERIISSDAKFFPKESFEYLLENNYIFDSPLLIKVLFSEYSDDLISWSKKINGLSSSSILVLLKYFMSTTTTSPPLPSCKILNILSLMFHSFDMKKEIKASLSSDEMLKLINYMLSILDYYIQTHSETISLLPSLESTLKWIEVIIDGKRDDILLEMNGEGQEISEKIEKIKEFLSKYTSTTEVLLELKGRSSMLCNLSEKNIRENNRITTNIEEKIEKTIISTITIPAL